MSKQDPETRYEHLPEALQFAFEQWSLQLNTCLPAHIVSYAPRTRRAIVQPALDLLMTDGQRLAMPAIPNVPVCWPSVNGYSLGGALQAGEPVLLIFSQRGLTGFKRAFERSAPDADRLMALSDAFALPGLGPISLTPASTTGLALQSHDASTLIALEPDGIRIVTPGALAIEAGSMTLNGAPVATR